MIKSFCKAILLVVFVSITVHSYQVTGQSDAASLSKINSTGTYIAEVDGRMREIRVLDVATFNTIRTFDINFGANISWHPQQEELLAFVGEDLPLTIVNIVTGESILEIQDYNDGSSISFSPDGTMLATSHGDTGIPTGRGTVEIRDSQNGNLLQVTTPQINPGLSNVSWSPDGTLIAAFQPDRLRLIIYDAVSGQLISGIGDSEFIVTRLYSWSPDGSTIAVDDAGNISLWNTQTYERILTSPYIGQVNDVEYSPDGRFIGIASASEGTLLLDSVTAEVVQQFPVTRSVIWTPDGSKVIISGINGYEQISVDPELASLELTSLCSTTPSTLRAWQVSNTSSEPVNFTWNVVGTQQTGSGTVPGGSEENPGEITFETTAVAASDTVTISVDGTVQDTVSSDSAGVSDTTSLITAITEANNSVDINTICLADGTYTLTASQVTDYGDNGLPLITSDITLVGLGDNVVIERGSGAPAFRLFHVKDTGALTLENVTLSNGDAGTTHGGAIYISGTDANVDL